MESGAVVYIPVVVRRAVVARPHRQGIHLRGFLIVRRLVLTVLSVLTLLGTAAPPALADQEMDLDDVRERVDPLPPELYPPDLRGGNTPAPHLADPDDVSEVLGTMPYGRDTKTTYRSSAPEPGVVGTFKKTECATPVDDPTVRCGYVTVPERHAKPGGARIQLAVAVLPATGPSPAPDAIVELAGGPGGTIVPFLPLVVDDPAIAALRVDRDVVLLEQRGIGLSVPALDCPEIDEATSDPEFLSALGDCRSRLVGAGIDIAAYNSLENAADVDTARAALDYEQWNVDTGSYGSYLSLLTAQLYPDGLRSQSIQSSIPLETNYPRETIDGIEGAVDELTEACAEDPACAPSGDLGAKLDDVLETLLTEDVSVDITIPTGERITIPLPAEFVGGIVVNAFYFGPAISELPAIINGLAEGDYQTFADIYLSIPPGPEPEDEVAFPDIGNAFGMTMSVLCSEQINRIDRDEFVADIADGSLLGQVVSSSNPIWGELALDACAVWDVPDADPQTYGPADTEVDTLVVNGRFDHVTPPRYGETITDQLPNAQLVTVPTGGHSSLFDPTFVECGLPIYLDFVDGPGEPVDTSCIDDVELELLVELPAVPSGRAITDACPDGAIPPAGFTDVGRRNVHGDAIDCIAAYGITEGVEPGIFAPADGVTRGQMASFIAREVTLAGGALPAEPENRFRDDDGSVHELRINQLAAVGIVQGTQAEQYAGGRKVTRAQMATFLARATEYVTGETLSTPKDYFGDDDGTFHEDNINKVAEARIFAGSGTVNAEGAPVFGVAKNMRRDQMASTLARSLDLYVEQLLVTPPTA